MIVDIPREIALKILYDINEKGAYSNISLDKYFESFGSDSLKTVDRAFITEIVYGTIKWRLTIDWIIQQFSRVKMKKISPWILNILRMGIYQLLYTDKVPESAACNESVKLAHKYGHSASRGYVNGILRNIARSRNNISYPNKEKDYNYYLSIKYSHPKWMVDRWVKRYGEEFTERLVAINNDVPDFTIRVNTLKISKDELVKLFNEAEIETRPGKYLHEALVVLNPSEALRSKFFKDGYFQIQDESSMIVAHVLDAKPGEFVIDVCSAPGGKATHIAQLMKNSGTVVARDIHPHKIQLIDDAANRLGASIIKSQVYDAVKLDNNYIQMADKVLVDAPCTGYGIIRRKPDIKWTKHEETQKDITALQAKILKTASSYVKPGGVLVYSTCTIEPEENEYMIEKFLEENRDFILSDISPFLPESIGERNSKGFIQLYPSIDGVDGFFIARMEKRR